MFIDKLCIFSDITYNYPLLNNLYSKMDVNDDFFNRKIRRLLRQYCLNCSVKIRGKRIWIQLCPYKLMYSTENNLEGATYKEFQEIINILQNIINEVEELCAIRVSTPIERFKVSEIDLTESIYTDYSFQTYIPMWECIKPKQNLTCSKSKNTNDFCTIEDFSTIYFRSKQRKQSKNSFTIRIYDKKKELNDRNIELASEYRQLNIMRVELAFNNSAIVRQKLKITMVEDILNDVNFNKLNDSRLNLLEGYLFNELINSENEAIDTLSIEELGKKIREENKRNALLLMALIYSTEDINYRELANVLLNLDFSQKHIDKQLKIIKKYKRLHKTKHRAEKISVNGLYYEVYEKLFGNYIEEEVS